VRRNFVVLILYLPFDQQGLEDIVSETETS
jgi:hypothetical protein